MARLGPGQSLPMASSSSVSFSLPRLRYLHPSKPHVLLPSLPLLAAPSRPWSPFRAFRRISSYRHEAVVVIPDARAGLGDLGGDDVDEDADEEEEEEDDDDDRSLDLLLRFVHNVFRKISRRARKAVRSVLPPSIPTNLVICTLGSMVFVSILFVRGLWSGLSYIRENHHSFMNRIDNDDSRWNGAQAAT